MTVENRNQPPVNPTIEQQVQQRKADKAAKEKRFEEERRTRLQELSKSPDEPPVTSTPLEEEEEEDPPVVSSTVEEEEETVDSSTADDDDDFDDFDEEEEETVSSSPEDEDEEEEEVTSEEIDDTIDKDDDVKKWRARIQEQGQLRKAAEVRAAEAEAEAEALKAQLTEVQEKSKHVAAGNINWNTHTEVAPMWDAFDNTILSGAESLKDVEMAKKFKADAQADLLTEYHGILSKAKTADDRLAASISFTTELEDRYNTDDGRPLVSAVKNAMETYIKITDEVESLKQKHEQGRLSVGVEEFQRSLKPYEDVFEDLGNVEADFIETNPSAVESVVGKRYAEDKEFKAAADRYKDRMKQFVFGLRPLTQTEIDAAEKRASSKGMTVEEYLTVRESNFQTKRKKFLNDVFYAGLSMDEFPEMQRVYAKYKANKRKRAGAKKVVSKASSSKKPEENRSPAPPKKAADREYIPPSRRDFSQR